MKRFGRIFVTWASAFAIALFLSACRASTPLGIVSPKNGATVPTLGDMQREYMSLPRAERIEKFSNPAYRKEMAARGYYPLPTVFQWSRDPDAQFSGGIAEVALFRDGDATPVFVTNVAATADGGSCSIDNLEIARKYKWKVTELNSGLSVTGCFTTDDMAPRLIRLPGVPNVRDLGGRVGLGGRRVKQGIVFRSAGLNDNASTIKLTPEEVAQHKENRVKGRNRLDAGSLRYALDVMGIRSDIDLRTPEECWGMTGSPLGPTVTWFHYSSAQYLAMDEKWGKAAFANVFRVFLDERNYPIDFHCIAGQDRTGAVAFIINGLLGVEEDELWRDWEATGFWNPSSNFVHDKFKKLLAVFDRYPGKTINEKIEAYVLSCGITEEEIARLRAILLE